MKFCSIIGTRPQYIKLKPLYDFLSTSGHQHIVVDTNQHYDYQVSGSFTDQLELKIDHNLGASNSTKASFLGECTDRIDKFLSCYTPDFVFVFGDTNTTVAAVMACASAGIRCGHIEAGVRCGDKRRPEEVNRIIADSLSDLQFASRTVDLDNLNYGTYVGDMEYALLNQRESAGLIKPISYDGPLLMTIHRQENVSVYRLPAIFAYCKKYGGPMLFPIHHRTKAAIDEFSIQVPSNVEVVDPLSYFDTLDVLSECKGLFTDSGGLTKISPFFGKKSLVPLESVEWSESFNCGYGHKGTDFEWFDQPIVPRNKELYHCKYGCETILKRILEL